MVGDIFRIRETPLIPTPSFTSKAIDGLISGKQARLQKPGKLTPQNRENLTPHFQVHYFSI